ncbi:MAG: hypothetical protein U9R39_00445 [Campylobacterota bacterium]|nr:hypothetical protein [Campylobacterota bacterium]
MNKLIISSLVLSGLLYANSSSVSYEYGAKDYKNSFSKVDGKVENINISHKISNHMINFGYQGDNVIRKANFPSLDVEKYSAKYIYKLNNKFNLKASYIKIIDNLAPTDQGKVYGFGVDYKFSKGYGAKADFYRSDYEPFNVNQYDLAIYKGFKADALKGKITFGTKIIKIDGDTYNPASPAPQQYNFYDKSYNTTFAKLGLNYNGYVAGVGAFFGKRAFTVLDGGVKVQHHAMEQDKTYMLSFGKKFKEFDIVAKYSFQNGKELPENRDDVDSKVMALSLTYKF